MRRACICLALLFSACSQAGEASCPSDTVEHAGHCVPRCTTNAGCTLGEVCQENICVPETDAGVSGLDAGVQDDATASTPDAGQADSGAAPDAMGQPDAPEPTDAGSFRDATDPIDSAILDDAATPLDGGMVGMDAIVVASDSGVSQTYDLAMIDLGRIDFAVLNSVAGIQPGRFHGFSTPNGPIDGDPTWVGDLVAIHIAPSGMTGPGVDGLYDPGAQLGTFSVSGREPSYARTGTNTTLVGIGVNTDPCLFTAKSPLFAATCFQMPEQAHRPQVSARGVVAYLNGPLGQPANLEFIDVNGGNHQITSNVIDFAWDRVSDQLIGVRQAQNGCELISVPARPGATFRRHVTGLNCGPVRLAINNQSNAVLLSQPRNGATDVLLIPYPQVTAVPSLPTWLIQSVVGPVTDVAFTPDGAFVAFIENGTGAARPWNLWYGPAGSIMLSSFSGMVVGDPHIGFREP
ncbi:MAG: EB domain-containing protein [Myxococcota bacterium]